MCNGIIMSGRSSHYEQVLNHTYFTDIQASNQAIKNQKPIIKAQNFDKSKKKNYKKIENFHKKKCTKGYMTSKNMHKRVHDFPPPHLNLIMFALGAKKSQQPQQP